ncbi:helix-turn-helix domain-containing protein [Kineosporia babensis]|uniref:Uncharacterized protein n=1 Tax=Kineosporia babensis TaxID=499548 RepID=A0A9X1ST43_9ACTN|nr:helix-turn-helix domain-containing protein [Kineosporia babensis]MCD5310931.1 hypothetical protein [Kineosporia babensis]
MADATTTPRKASGNSRSPGAYSRRPYNEHAVREAMAGRPDYMTPAECWEAVRRLLATGMNTAEIARRVQRDPSQIRRIRCTFRAEAA